MVTLNMNFFFATVLKQQCCIWYSWFIFERAQDLLGTGLCPSCPRMVIWISMFGTEWVTRSHQNSNLLANITNEGTDTRVTRSNEKDPKFSSFVRVSTLNSLLFSKQCDDSDAPNKALLVTLKWDGSRGKVVKHVFELCDELKMFFNEKGRP